MNTTIYYFLIYIAEALICIQYTSNIFSDRFSHFKTFIAIFILYSTLFIISLLQNPYINVIVFFIFHIFIFCCLFQTTKLNAVFHSLILTITMIFTELIVLTIYSNISVHFYTEIYIHHITLVMAIISKLLYFIITFFISHTLLKNSNNTIPFSSRECFLLCIIPILSLWISFTFIHLCLTTPLKNKLDAMISISMLFILLINILIFGLFEHIKQKNSEIAELTLQNQRDADSVEYYKALVSQDEKQKVLIHDIKKHLNAIASLNEQHDSEKKKKKKNRSIPYPRTRFF